MSSPALRVVEKENDVDKNKALEAAVSQIERAFGKGSIMRLGQDDVINVESHLHRFARARYRARHRRDAARPYR